MDYVYVIDIYVGKQYYDTVEIPASQVESGEYEKDIEVALSVLGKDAKVVATNLLRRIKDENKAITHTFKPGEIAREKPVTVRYAKVRESDKIAVTEPTWAKAPPFELEGPSCVLVDDSLKEQMEYPGASFKLEEGLGIIQCRAQAKGIDLEIETFNGLYPIPGIRYKLHFSKTYSESKGERKFSRILILCHGMRQVFKEGDKWVDRGAPTIVTGWRRIESPSVTLKPDDIFNVVGPYLETGGALYIGACKQWQCNWEYEVFESGYEGEVYTLPGGGECATLISDLSWWERVADQIFGSRTTENLATITIFD